MTLRRKNDIMLSGGVNMYKIGDVSRILGISSDIMRYYEKRGIVKPHKGKDNSYRYYEAWDVNFLIECLWFKEYGFSIKEIAGLVSDYPFDELCEQMELRSEEMEEAINRQQLLQRRLRQQAETLKNCRELIGKCEIATSPEMVRYLNRYNYTYDESEEMLNLSKEWVKNISFARRSFSIKEDVLLSGGTNFAWGFSLEMEYVKELGVDIKPPVVYFPPQKCIHSVFKQPGKYNFSPKLLQHMVDYAQENNLTICGPAQGSLLCSVREDAVLTGYFDAWIPIE